VAIDINLQKTVIALTNGHWAKLVKDPRFAELISGKEPGHRMADYVDDQTVSLLKVQTDIETRYEGDGRGSVRKRSMGDIWVRSKDVFNPINIKSGLQGMGGQPNLVSMHKLLDYMCRSRIDSYYLLIVKFSVANVITHKTYLVDLLDWLDFVAYDAGPGQLMLREKDFYRAFEKGHKPPVLSLIDKARRLFELSEQQLRKLFANRNKRLRRQKDLLDQVASHRRLVDQSDMEFVP